MAVCSGKDCARDERKAHRSLRSVLSDDGLDVVPTKCLGVCHGPVAVVVSPSGRAVVVEKLKKKGRQRALADAVRSGRLKRAAAAGPVVRKSKRRKKALSRAGTAMHLTLRPR